MRKLNYLFSIVILAIVLPGCSKQDTEITKITMGSTNLGTFTPNIQKAYKTPEGYVLELSADTIDFIILLPELNYGNHAITQEELSEGKAYFNINFVKSQNMGTEGSVTITDTANHVISGTYNVNKAVGYYIKDENFKITDGKFEISDIKKIQYGSVEDYEHNKYKTVIIGTQTWMAENLKSRLYANGDPIKDVWGYLNDNENEKKYGLLYVWNSAMNNVYGEKAQGACPDGWHLPSKDEWNILIDNLGGEMVAGGKMKSPFSWQFPNFGASNLSGFTVLAAGMHYPEVEISNHSERLSYQSFFWSSSYDKTINGLQAVWTYLIDNFESSIYGAPYFRGDQGNSMRCIKN